MKRYRLIDLKTGHIAEYSKLAWDLAWLIMFAMGVATGIVGYIFLLAP